MRTNFFLRIILILVGMVAVFLEISLFQYWIVPLFLISVYFFRLEPDFWLGVFFGLAHDFVSGGRLGGSVILILVFNFLMETFNVRRGNF